MVGPDMGTQDYYGRPVVVPKRYSQTSEGEKGKESCETCRKRRRHTGVRGKVVDVAVRSADEEDGSIMT